MTTAKVGVNSSVARKWSSSAPSNLIDGNHVTQLVAKQVLKMPDIGRKPECAEWTASIREQVADAPGDQESNDVVVERPPSFVPRRERMFDEAQCVVDDGYRHGEHLPIFVPSDCECHLRARHGLANSVQPILQILVGAPATSATQELVKIVERVAWVADNLTPDTSARSVSEVGPQRLPTASGHVVRVVAREKQDPATKSRPRQNAERPDPEVLVEGFPGGRTRERDVDARRSEE